MYGIAPRSPLDLSAPVFARRGHPPERFLGFADGMRRLLVEAVDWVEQHPKASAGKREEMARRFEKRMRWLITRYGGDADVARMGKNLKKRWDALFTFVRIPGISWHNNAAERAVRPVVIKRKMSGGLRSAVGARVYSVLRSVHETCKRKGQSFVQTVLDALAGVITRGPPSMASRA